MRKPTSANRDAMMFLIFMSTLQESVEDTLLADKRRLAREVRFYYQFHVHNCFMSQVFLEKVAQSIDIHGPKISLVKSSVKRIDRAISTSCYK